MKVRICEHDGKFYAEKLILNQSVEADDSSALEWEIMKFEQYEQGLDPFYIAHFKSIETLENELKNFIKKSNFNSPKIIKEYEV